MSDQLHILHIEDDSVDAECVGRLIGTKARVTQADSFQGVGYWVNPDIILLDLNLGSEVGLEVLRECLGRFPRKPIVALSGYTSEHERLEHFHGAIVFLDKRDLTATALIQSMMNAAELTAELNTAEVHHCQDAISELRKM